MGVLLLTAAVALAAHAGYGVLSLATRSGGSTGHAEAGFATSAAFAATGGLIALLAGSLLVAVGSDGVGGSAPWRRGVRRGVAAVLLPAGVVCLVVGGAMAGFAAGILATRRGATDVDQALRDAGHVPIWAGLAAAAIGTLLLLLAWALLSGPVSGTGSGARRAGAATLPTALSLAGGVLVVAALAASAGGSGQLFGVLEPSNYERHIAGDGTLTLYPLAEDTDGDGDADRFALTPSPGSGSVSTPLTNTPIGFAFPLEPDLTGALRIAGDGSKLTLSLSHLGTGTVRVRAILLSGEIPVLNGTATTAARTLPSPEAQTVEIPLRVEGGNVGLLRGPVVLGILLESTHPQAEVKLTLGGAALRVALAP